jgi:ATP-dependent Clp protease, protease subunit
MLLNSYIDLSKKKSEKKASSAPFAEKLLKKRVIMLFGEINMEVARDISAKLMYLDSFKEKKPIKLIINSPGGHVESGDTIHDMIKFIQSPVYIIGTGWVASAGVLIYLAADKDKRLTLPNTRFMLHQPIGGMQGQATDIEIHAREIIKTKERINKIISEQTGQSMPKVSEDTDRDYWLSAEEAVSYGIVSRVISSIDEI